MTFGELTGLLVDLGFYPKVLDEHRVIYFETNGDWYFGLPNQPPNSPARDSDVSLVRRQLDMRGLMEKDEFDARFGQPRTPAKR